MGVGNEYFNAPRRGGGQVQQDDDNEGTTQEGGGMVTGQQGNEDIVGLGGGGVGLGFDRVGERKRRRTRKEQLEEEDSSDLSDEDSESEREKTAAQGILFQKVNVRGRSKSSPPPSSQRTAYQVEDEDEGEGRGLEVMVTSPSNPPPETSRLQTRGRGSSFSSGRVETVKQRARRDTTTSSEMSSENEQLDPHGAFFNRKLPGRPDQRVRKTVLLAERIQEENDELEEVSGEERLRDSDLEDEDVDEASDLSDEFEAANGESPELGMMGIGLGGVSDDPSPLKPPPQADVPSPVEPTQNQGGSPKKKGEKEIPLPKLPKLPPGRPMSRLPPPSLITMALKGGNGSGSGGAGEKPYQRFADLSGKGEARPLWIKIFAPFCSTPTDPLEVPLRRTREGQPVTVSELIGLALWRYNEEEYQPPLAIDAKDSNINRWDLRIVEDGEVDYDFPALVRTRPVTDFTSNNNRPPQRRARDKPWDEFGLVRATEEQFNENEEMTPQIGAMTALPPPQEPPKRPEPAMKSDSETSVRSVATATFHPAPRNPITGPCFTSAALHKDTGNLALDAPQRETAQSTPRTGAPKTVIVHHTDPQSFATSSLSIPTTADTYIAEIFDHSCQRLGLEKGLYVLKVHGTQTVAPSDRTVEALGERLGLDLVRRRFIGGAGAGDGIFGLGLSGSPGSSSPNAPLEMLPQQGTPPPGGKKAKRVPAAFSGFTSAPFATATTSGTTSSTNFNLVGLGLALPAELGGIGGKKYNVLRKQPLSFSPSHPRTLIITPEYMQILPAAPDSLVAPTGKVTNVPMSSVVGVKVSRKHPKMVRVLVYREKETKRYDFEAGTKEEAAAIVGDVRRALDAGGVGVAF